MAQIDYLNQVLGSETMRYQIIYDELIEIESKFGDDRRTELMVGEIHNIDDEDLIEESNVIVTLTQNGYIKRIDDVEFRAQNRGGTGVKGMSMNDDDFVETMLSTSTHDSVLFFTNTGRVFHSKGYEIPEFEIGRAHV